MGSADAILAAQRLILRCTSGTAARSACGGARATLSSSPLSSVAAKRRATRASGGDDDSIDGSVSSPSLEPQPEAELALHLLVASASARRLAAEGGAALRAYQERTGATVILPLPRDVPPGSGERLVEVRGTASVFIYRFILNEFC